MSAVGLLPHPAPFILLGASITLLGISIARHRELRASFEEFLSKVKFLKINLVQRFGIKCTRFAIDISTAFLLWPSLALIFRIITAKHLTDNLFTYLLDLSIIGGIGLWITAIILFEMLSFSFENNTKKHDTIMGGKI